MRQAFNPLHAESLSKGASLEIDLLRPHNFGDLTGFYAVYSTNEDTPSVEFTHAINVPS